MKKGLSLPRLAAILILAATQLVQSVAPIVSRSLPKQQVVAALPSPGEVQAVAKRVNDYWIAHHTGPDDYNWSRATYFTGDMAHYQMSGDARYLDYAWNWAEKTTQWQINGGCDTVFAEYHTPGQTYLALYQIDPERAKLDCILSSIEQSASWGWIEIDLGSTTNLQRLSLVPFQNRAYRYLVDLKENPADPYTLAFDRSDGSLDDVVLSGKAARFVRVRVIGASGYAGPRVTLGEVNVFDDDGTNVALNRPVTCSSEPEAQNSCAQAVDGRADTFWSAVVPDPLTTASPDWWWVDALYVAAPLYAGLSRVEEEGALPAKVGYASLLFAKYDEAKTQIGLFNSSEGLWYRDARFFGLHSPNDKEIFWSRGNGWALAALARILDILPPSDAHYQEYLQTFRLMANSLIARQDPAGYWNENLADPEHCGGPESSGTAFFSFGLAWGINNGVLDRVTYLPSLLRAWQWLTTTAVQSSPDGLFGYVQPIGDAPACDGNTHLPGPTDSADFGVGAFLLAAAEMVQLPSSTHFNSTLHLPQIWR